MPFAGSGTSTTVTGGPAAAPTSTRRSRTMRRSRSRRSRRRREAGRESGHLRRDRRGGGPGEVHRGQVARRPGTGERRHRRGGGLTAPVMPEVQRQRDHHARGHREQGQRRHDDREGPLPRHPLHLRSTSRPPDPPPHRPPRRYRPGLGDANQAPGGWTGGRPGHRAVGCRQITAGRTRAGGRCCPCSRTTRHRPIGGTPCACSSSEAPGSWADTSSRRCWTRGTR